MNTIGMWHERILPAGPQPPTGPKPIDVGLHINFWKLLPSKGALKKFRYLLDIGLMIKDINPINHVLMYFPLPVKKEHIKDLGGVIISKSELTSAVFNDRTIVHDEANEKTKKVTRFTAEEQVDFQVYCIDVENDVSVDPNTYGGTVIKIDTSRVRADEGIETYLRIRLCTKELIMFFQMFRPKDGFFEKAYTQTEVLDIRVNESRNLQNTLLDKMKDGRFNFTKVHFLHLRDASDDFVFSHKPLSASRQLEPDLWRDYVEGGLNVDNILAYHWKEKNAADSYNALVKSKFRKFNWLRILTYTIATIIIALVLNTAGGLLSNKVPGYFQGRAEAKKTKTLPASSESSKPDKKKKPTQRVDNVQPVARPQ